MTDITQWKVILVDDEPDSLNLLHDTLALNGAEVYRASDGEQCLTLLETVTPTLIVVDLAMPGMDGWSLFSRIRGNPALAHVPIAAITAFYSTRVAQEAYEAGFAAFFEKPTKSATFLDKLKEIVSN